MGFGGGGDTSNQISAFTVRTPTSEPVTFCMLKINRANEYFWGVIHLLLKQSLKTDEDDWHPKSADFTAIIRVKGEWLTHAHI